MAAHLVNRDGWNDLALGRKLARLRKAKANGNDLDEEIATLQHEREDLRLEQRRLTMSKRRNANNSLCAELEERMLKAY